MTGLIIFVVAVAIFSWLVFTSRLNEFFGLIDSIEDSIEKIENQKEEQ